MEKKGNEIQSVTGKQIETGKELVFTAPLFADCTGDGTVGVLAGADFTTGRESKAEFGEPNAPEKADKMTMGGSTGMMGKVVGIAAAVCKRNNAKPRAVYEKYLDDLKSLMKKGVGKESASPYPSHVRKIDLLP